MPLTFREKLTLKQYRNPVIKGFLDSLPEKEAGVAIKTITFIKENFPEVRDVLRGEVIQEESWALRQQD